MLGKEKHFNWSGLISKKTVHSSWLRALFKFFPSKLNHCFQKGSWEETRQQKTSHVKITFAFEEMISGPKTRHIWPKYFLKCCCSLRSGGSSKVEQVKRPNTNTSTLQNTEINKFIVELQGFVFALLVSEAFGWSTFCSTRGKLQRSCYCSTLSFHFAFSRLVSWKTRVFCSVRGQHELQSSYLWRDNILGHLEGHNSLQRQL